MFYKWKIVQMVMAIPVLFCLLCCNQPAPTAEIEKKELSHAETLYYLSDTVIASRDTLRIVNTKLDTVVVEIGIFSYLQFDYSIHIPPKMIELAKMAVRMDREGSIADAHKHYRSIIAYYNDDRLQDLKRFSDGNLYFRYENNCAILCSYAYERLDHLEQAISTLKPFLANCETRSGYCRINSRFMQLCIRKYGMDKVRSEVRQCPKTIQFAKVDGCRDNWTVKVFDAKIGLEKPPKVDEISIGMTDTLVRAMDFYALLH